MAKLVYVLDDDENIRNIIEKFLMYEGFQVEKYKTGTELLRAYELNRPDCFVIDIMLPDMSGFKVCQKIREESNIPILFVSAKGEEMDRILGLEIGGDDYITKPFSGRELAVRVKALLRRSVNTALMEELGTFQLGNLTFQLDQREVSCLGEPMVFTAKEYDLFVLLSKNSPKAFSREELFRLVWKWEVIDGTRSVDDLVKRIRKKLASCNSLVEIKTVFGFGYKVQAESGDETLDHTA
ncbi:MAG: response regulator transcription factor [Candidatus Izemoplasmatales bacterium]|nr:response regulator transcription factor [Candidatus Izemoplasmatales bacterium]